MKNFVKDVLEKLRAKIDKMKCCGNCSNYYCSNDTKGHCKLVDKNEYKCGFNTCNKWGVSRIKVNKDEWMDS